MPVGAGGAMWVLGRKFRGTLPPLLSPGCHGFRVLLLGGRVGLEQELSWESWARVPAKDRKVSKEGRGHQVPGGPQASP